MRPDKMLKLEQKEHAAYVTLNRPEKRNTMTLGFFEEMVDVFRHLDRDDSVSAVVVGGAGKCFTGGLDLEDTASSPGSGLRIQLLGLEKLNSET